MECAAAASTGAERTSARSDGAPQEAAAAAAAASPPGSSTGGVLVFDLNFHEHTTDDEAGALCRQLTMSFAANRRAAKPFPLLVLGGVGVPEAGSDGPTADAAAAADAAGTTGSGWGASADGERPLLRMLSHSNWWSSPGVRRSGSPTPWEGLTGDVVYLTADSPHTLEDLPDSAAACSAQTTYVVGGIVDRVEKPGLSYRRAVAAGVRTARLPLEKFLQLRSGGKKAEEGNGCRRADDVTTLAVVQMLLLFRESGAENFVLFHLLLCLFRACLGNSIGLNPPPFSAGRWGDAVSSCPALRCAPLRKYVRWLPPYEELNGAKRQDVFSQQSTSSPSGQQQQQGQQPQKRKAAPGLAADEQVANADSNKKCEACGAGFASRNALFRHLQQCTAVAAAETVESAPT
jgi:hypothetical protein